MRLVRDGLHIGAWQWALVKVTPRAARRSRFGVFACGCPPSGPTQSFRSSTAMKRTLGWSAAATATGGEARNRSARAAKTIAMLRLGVTTRHNVYLALPF